jgi:hypothetical protein
MLSQALAKEQPPTERRTRDIADVAINEEGFDELSAQKTFIRRRSTKSKIDFCAVRDNVIRCVCANIIAHIQTNERSGYTPPREYEIFDKEEGSLVSTRSCLAVSHCLSFVCLSQAYDLDTVSFVFKTVHQESQMEFECIVIALIYLERLPRLTGGKLRLCALNWRFLLFTCMMLSSKIW